jgi:hypothetical protein
VAATTTVAQQAESTHLEIEPSQMVLSSDMTRKATYQHVSNTPPASHKPSITDDLVFFDQFTKQELLDQYSRSEICLPLALREQLDDPYSSHRLTLEHEQEDRVFDGPKLSCSTTQIDQIDEQNPTVDGTLVAERSNSCKCAADLFVLLM